MRRRRADRSGARGAAQCARHLYPDHDGPQLADDPGPVGRRRPGAYEAGAVAALAEHGLPIRLVAGSSAGALTAAMVVAGRADRLEATWRAITQDQVYAMRAPTFFAGCSRAG
jgi:hypothetical protein